MTKSGKHCGKRNFFFCYYVFKKPSAAEASESGYMRERVKLISGGIVECAAFTSVVIIYHLFLIFKCEYS